MLVKLLNFAEGLSIPQDYFRSVDSGNELVACVSGNNICFSVDSVNMTVGVSSIFRQLLHQREHVFKDHLFAHVGLVDSHSPKIYSFSFLI